MKRGHIAVALRLAALVRPMLPVMALAILLGTLGFLAAIAIPVLGGYGMLSALVHKPLAGMMVLLGICAVTRGFFRYAEHYCNHYIAFKLLAIIRDRVFRAMRRLSPAKLEARDKGGLVSLITADIELLEVFYAHTLSPVAIAVLVSAIMALFIGGIHPLLGAVAVLGYLSVGALLPALVAKHNRSAGADYREGFADLNTFVLESLRGLREIIQFGAGESRLAEMDSKTDSLAAKAKKLQTYEGLTSALAGASITVFAFAMLFASTALMEAGQIRFGGAMVATVAMVSSFGPVTALANLANNLSHTFAAGNRVLDILDETPVARDITGGADVSFDGAALEKVSFSYGGEPVFRDFSIAFQKSHIIGIGGKSGAGKSTLLRLLMRFWDAQGGVVSVSDKDVRKLNTECLRGLEGFVTQDTHIFNDTIANNIRIACTNATQAQMEEACRKASVHEFIANLPRGYETNAGELGSSLSGGERQRIGLARAFLHDAPFMLLDEPTSNLDSLNEAVILRSIKEENGGKTVVLVSHRRSALGIADTICIVDKKPQTDGI